MLKANVETMDSRLRELCPPQSKLAPPAAPKPKSEP